MLFQLDPFSDARWPRFLDRHPKASIFHTPEWLQSLSKTYGYRAMVFTFDPPEVPLTNGIVCCEVNSWLTGRRLVSLPFSDHCEPLVGNAQDFHFLLSELRKYQSGRWKYIEIRPRSDWIQDIEDRCGFSASARYCFHTLDLKPELEELYRGFHGNSVRRKIRRAEREGLIYEEGRSGKHLDKFYHLLLLTRRRHHLPPQPLNWFQNLISCFGERLKIRLASKNGRPIAGILTLRHKKTTVYKYGCSDASVHNLGGMVMLFWKAIEEAKQAGLEELDFGRSNIEQTGLIQFKNHWGTTKSVLTYLRYPPGKPHSPDAVHTIKLANRVFARTPNGILVLAGRLLYKHFA